MNIESVIENCKAEIESHPLHHLERKYRNDLFNSINDIEISLRLLLNATFKVLEIFTTDYPNDKSIYDFIERIKEYINGGLEKEVLLNRTKLFHTYMDNRLSDEKYDAIYVGYSIVSCSYEIIKKQVIYTDVDEFDDEPDNWSSCFYASLAYNNGSSDLTAIDPEKNRTFWYWFLDEGLKLSQELELLQINKESIPTIDDKIIPQRQQINLLNNNTEINAVTQQLDEIFKGLINKEGWVEFKLEGYYVSNNRSLAGYYKLSSDLEFEKLEGTRFYLLGKQFNLLKVLGDLRDKMYRLFPEEGAWYQTIINFSLNNPGHYHFIYDEKADFFDKWVDKTAFADDFVVYERKDKYTPLWLEAIVKS
ncbi:MAG: hypothetical protein JWR38_4620 [Mucilaginibacter sp.]|nr:hypothetical protein [Mucilaginibacter sp.]